MGRTNSPFQVCISLLGSLFSKLMCVNVLQLSTLSSPSLALLSTRVPQPDYILPFALPLKKAAGLSLTHLSISSFLLINKDSFTLCLSRAREGTEREIKWTKCHPSLGGQRGRDGEETFPEHMFCCCIILYYFNPENSLIVLYLREMRAKEVKVTHLINTESMV